MLADIDSDESFEAFLDALPDVEPPEHLKHSVFAALDVGEHTSPTAPPSAEVVAVDATVTCMEVPLASAIWEATVRFQMSS